MTQREAILQYIDEFGSITPMEAFAELGITKLATRISKCEKTGCDSKLKWLLSKADTKRWLLMPNTHLRRANNGRG